MQRWLYGKGLIYLTANISANKISLPRDVNCFKNVAKTMQWRHKSGESPNTDCLIRLVGLFAYHFLVVSGDCIFKLGNFRRSLKTQLFLIGWKKIVWQFSSVTLIQSAYTQKQSKDRMMSVAISVWVNFYSVSFTFHYDSRALPLILDSWHFLIQQKFTVVINWSGNLLQMDA